jgi:hypothetical protein
MEYESEFSDPDQDQRTGNQIYSRHSPSAEISLINSSSLSTLVSSNPATLLLGCARDRNPRGNPASISGTTGLIGLVKDNEFNVLRPDADLQQNNWVGSLITPNSNTCCAEYRIISSTLYQDAYGDVNGDGKIDLDDLAIINGWVQRYTYDGTLSSTPGVDISDAYGMQLVIDGYVDIMQFLRADVDGDGKVDSTDVGLLEDFINNVTVSFSIGSSFSRMELKVENVSDPANTSVDIPNICSSFVANPFSSIPWRIDYVATWTPDLVSISDSRRLLSTTFTDAVSGCSGGQNNFFVPGDLMVDGSLKNVDGTDFRIDFEMTHLSLKVPVTDSGGNPVFIDGYSGILLFDTFVAEEADGKTTSGFDAMKYSDDTFVQSGDFSLGKVKLVPSIQSTSSSFTVPFGGQLNDIVGLNYNEATSLMTLYISDGYQMIAQPAVNTRILVEVYLKKSGFRNETQSITEAEMRALLGI